MRTDALLTSATAVLSTFGIGVAQRASSAPAGTTLRATETLTSVAPADFGTKALHEGDPIAFASKLTDGSGTNVGSEIGNCTVIVASGEKVTDAMCTSTYRLRGGTLIVSGPYDQTTKKLQRDAIVGGTGDYEGAKGVVEFTNASADSFNLTFRIRS